MLRSKFWFLVIDGKYRIKLEVSFISNAEYAR